MNRKPLLWFGAVALLLLFAAWWFTVMSASARPMPVLAPVVAPAALLIASSILSWAGWRKGISGLLVLAASILGIGLIGITQWLVASATPVRALWLLLPAFSGAGILIENHLGIGWRFSDRQGFWMIRAALALFLIALLWSMFAGSGGLDQRIIEPFQNPVSLFSSSGPDLPVYDRYTVCNGGTL